MVHVPKRPNAINYLNHPRISSDSFSQRWEEMDDGRLRGLMTDRGGKRRTMAVNRGRYERQGMQMMGWMEIWMEVTRNESGH